MSKNIFTSKTFWLNALTIGGTILTGGFGSIPALAAHPGVVTGVLAGINIGLRVVTTDPVTILPASK